MNVRKVLDEVQDELVRKGAVRGMAKALFLVLERRFGSLPARAIRLIDNAEAWLLEKWLAEVTDGAGLDDLFGPADEDSELSPAAKELLAEGEAKGKRAALRLILQRRFGRLDETTLRLIERAAPQQLQTWLEQSLDGRTLEVVLGRPPSKES